MKPFLHARVSVRRFGGIVDDYIALHEFFDSPKSANADIRFRAILHNSFGPYLAERVFGNTIVNSDGNEVSVRDVAEQHILDDLGCIPSVSDWCKLIDLQALPGWARGVRTTNKQEVYNFRAD